MAIVIMRKSAKVPFLAWRVSNLFLLLLLTLRNSIFYFYFLLSIWLAMAILLCAEIMKIILASMKRERKKAAAYGINSEEFIQKLDFVCVFACGSSNSLCGFFFNECHHHKYNIDVQWATSNLFLLQTICVINRWGIKVHKKTIFHKF